ncbi:MAG: SRPBCC domain-containing protein [Chloroflexi bacterium]|nr:SRPBCC domain-containing protein [Chloroflexota bacterium]
MTLEQLSTGPTSVWVNRAGRQLIVERVFDAPRDLVWRAWITADVIARWWGPRGWTTTNYQMDVRPGGVWHYCMRGPEGVESWGKAVYREVVEPERLVFYDVFSDADGNTVEGMPGMLITLEFADLDGKTRLTSRTEFATTEELESLLAMGVIQGLSETWDRLEEYLAAPA